jgi:GT2 family glycosyltransferase
MTARIRAVVLNYNGGEHVVACVEALARTDWPADAFEIVVVDNASADGSDAEIRRRFPDVQLIPSGGNHGFPANNLAMADLDEVDHVALVNNDAFVEPGWLRPLVETIESDHGLGATCPRIVFAPGFVDLAIESSTFVPGRGDGRDLGVRLSGVRVDGVDQWAGSQRVDGFWGIEHGSGDEVQFEWTTGRADLRAPVEPQADGPFPVDVRLAAEEPKSVRLASGDEWVDVEVGPEPMWHRIDAPGPARDVVNNAGSRIVEGGYGGDRGFLAPDGPDFDEAVDVFAWCGGGVLLRREYLEDVGLFDERFFLYYEDTDLSWRGRARGWRYRYVPGSRIRHIHAASSGEGSAVFQHFVERNRLVMLTKNAPLGLAVSAVWRYLLVTASYARRDVVAPMLRGHRPNSLLLRRRVGSFLGYLRLLGPSLLARRRQRRGQVVTDADLVAWMEPQ